MRHLALLALFACITCVSAAEETKKDPNAGVVLDPATTEVWSTEKGSKYHTKDCPSAKVKTNLAAAVADEDTPCAKCAPPVYDATKIIVFLGGEAGKKYHLFSCKFAKTQTTLAKATADGLTGCSVCKPPVLWAQPKAEAKPEQPAPAK